MGKNILLTGATGFIGRHLIDELRGDNLSAISKNSRQIDGVSKVYQWADIETIEGPFDAVVLLAGLAHDTQNSASEQAYFDVNQGLTEKILSNCDRWNVKTFIYLSSVKAVADSTSEEQLDETSESTATHVYGRSKRAAEQSIESSSISGSKIILRPVLVYGPNQKGNLQTLEKLLSKRVPLPFGKWANKRSVLYVGNLTSTIRRMVDKKTVSGTYFISDDKPVSTVELLKLIGLGIHIKPMLVPVPNRLIKAVTKILPGKLRVFSNKILGDLQVSNEKLKMALNIQEMPFSTEDGFKETYRNSK